MRELILGMAIVALGACGQPAGGPAEPAVPASPVDTSPAGVAALGAELTEVVRVSREIVEARLVLLNTGTRPLDLGTRFALREEDGPSISGLVLLEETVQKKSFVLRDARDQPLCSSGLTPLEPGERRAVWARFPAPGGSTVIAQLPGLPPFPAVEVPAAETP